jgi:hypothetical protein
MQCTHQQMRKCVSPRLNVGILPIITMAQVPQALCSAILSLFLEPFQSENSHCEKLALTPLPRIPTLGSDLLHWCPRASQISISSWHLLDALLQPASPHLLAHSSPRPRSQGRTLLTDHIVSPGLSPPACSRQAPPSCPRRMETSSWRSYSSKPMMFP